MRCNDEAIDTAAKSLIPMLENDLKAHRTLYASDFTDRAISALKTGMPELIGLWVN